MMAKGPNRFLSIQREAFCSQAQAFHAGILVYTWDQGRSHTITLGPKSIDYAGYMLPLELSVVEHVFPESIQFHNLPFLDLEALIEFQGLGGV